MTKSQELYNKAKEEGNIDEKKEYIKFKDKDTGQGTGEHTLKFIKDEQTDGTNYRTKKPEKKMRYTFEENGNTKFYEPAIFKKDPDGEETKELANFIVQMNSFDYGETIKAHYEPIEGTYKGFIKVTGTNTPKEEEIPIIQEDDFIPDPDPKDM